MSKQRQRDRAAREAQEAQERVRQAAAAAGAQRAARLRPALPELPRLPQRPPREPVYRQRRFPPLPWRLKLALALGWGTAAVLVLSFVPTWTGRLGFLVLATFALPLVVVLVRDPTRRTR